MKVLALAALGAALAFVGCGGGSSPQTTSNAESAGLNAPPNAPPRSAPWSSGSKGRPPNAAGNSVHSGRSSARSAASARRRRVKVESQTQLGRRTFRIVYPGTGCPGPCAPRLQEEGGGGHTWKTIRRLTDSQGFGERVLAGGGNVYVVFFGNPAGGAPDAHARLEISPDQGATWSVRGDPCGRLHGREEDTVRAAAAGRWLALLCEPRATSRPFFVALSHDGGKTFVRSAPIPLPFATSVSVAVGGTLTVSNRHRGRAVSHDRGRTWTKTTA
jgi:hypothetical protein